MSEHYADRSGNTEAFQAFVQREEPAPPARPPRLIVASAVVLAVLIIGAIVWLVAA